VITFSRPRYPAVGADPAIVNIRTAYRDRKGVARVFALAGGRPGRITRYEAVLPSGELIRAPRLEDIRAALNERNIP